MNNEMDDFATSAGPNMFGLLQGAQNRVEDGWHGLTQLMPPEFPAQDAGAVGF